MQVFPVHQLRPTCAADSSDPLVIQLPADLRQQVPPRPQLFRFLAQSQYLLPHGS